MFGFLKMPGTYESRKVGRYEVDDVLVSTAEVTDSEQPYETAICHPKYNCGSHVIVEMYDTREQAITGHDKWVNLITSSDLPETLKDVSTCELAKCRDAFGDDWREIASKN